MWDNQDGTRTLDISTGHLHYKDKATGAFLPRNWALTWDGGLRVWGFGQNSFEPTFPEFADGWCYFRDVYQGKDQTLGFKAVAAHVPGVQVGNTVVYANAFGAGRDLIYQPNGWGIRKLIRFKAGTYPTADFSADWQVSIPTGLKAYRETIQAIKTELDLTKTNVIPLDDLVAIGLDQLDGQEWFTYLRQAHVWDSGQNKIGPVQLSFYRQAAKGYLRKTIPASYFVGAVGDVYADTPVDYLSTSDDGWVGKYISGTWAACHDATSGTFDVTGFVRVFTWRGTAGAEYEINRGHIPFDTSAIPDAATITAATLSMWLALAAEDVDADGDDWINVVQATIAGASLAGGDYDTMGAVSNPTEGATRKGLSTLSTTAWNVWTLNATGLGWINKTGITRLALREGHDALNLAIAVDGFNRARFESSATAGSEPYLSVTYSTATVYNRTCSRSGSISASAARIGTFRRTASRTGSLTASTARAATFRRTASRTGSIAATVARAATFGRAASRAGSVNVAVARIGTFRRAPSRTGSVTPTVVVNKAKVKALSFTGTIAATVARIGIFGRTASRTGSVSATTRHGGIFGRALSRTGSIVATVSRAVVPAGTPSSVSEWMLRVNKWMKALKPPWISS